MISEGEIYSSNDNKTIFLNKPKKLERSQFIIQDEIYEAARLFVKFYGKSS